jgi:cytochrome c553
MKTKHAPLVLLSAFMLFAAQVQAESLVDGSIEAGKAKALTCTACHGAEGNSSIPTWPNIAGQSAGYIVAQLNAFKGGLRADPLMAPQAMMLSEMSPSILRVCLPPQWQSPTQRPSVEVKRSIVVEMPMLASRLVLPATARRGAAIRRLTTRHCRGNTPWANL